MNKHEFDNLCKQSKAWRQFKKEVLECADNVLPRDKIVEIMPKNLMQFAFSKWSESGCNIFSKESVFEPQIIELQPTTIDKLSW